MFKLSIVFMVVLVLLLGISSTNETKFSSSRWPSICHNQDGILVPMRGSCNGFFICVHGNAIASSCGYFYHFNKQTSVCDHPARAGCLNYETQEFNIEILSQKAPASLLPEAIAAASSLALPQPKHPDEVRVDRTAGDICSYRTTGIMLPKPDSCSQYFVCIMGYPYRRSCPPNQYFNAAKQLCQDTVLLQCVMKMPNVVMQPPKLQHAEICEGIADGTMLPHPADCGIFFVCNRARAVEMRCTNGLDFNVQEQRCDWPWLANCTLQ